jgi:hypothetical protein
MGGKARHARRRELCATCSPGRNTHARLPERIEHPSQKGEQPA